MAKGFCFLCLTFLSLAIGSGLVVAVATWKPPLPFIATTYSSSSSLPASLIGSSSVKNIREDVARFLQLTQKSDEMERLGWLGLFDDNPVPIEQGANVDILVHLMLQKMSYNPGERDMIIVHDEVTAKFPDRTEQRSSSLRLEGIPHGDSAMSRAVSLPAAVASKLILEGQIKAKGVHMPTLPEIYQPVLQELENFNFKFSHNNLILK